MMRRPIQQLLHNAGEDDWLAPAELARLSMPVMLMWGRGEIVLPRAHYDFFARHLPSHAEIVTPRHFGHAPHVDNPAAVAAYVRRFAAADGARR